MNVALLVFLVRHLLTRRSVRIFFCFNQVSYWLATSSYKFDGKSTYTVFLKQRVFAPERQNQGELDNVSLRLITLLSCCSSRLEVVIPHAKNGRSFLACQRFARNLSYVDDGMDTFRREPKNIDLAGLRHGVKFYTYKYQLPLAPWLSSLKLVELGHLVNLYETKRCPKSPITERGSGVQTVVVESTGLMCDISKFDRTRTVIATHQRATKNTLVIPYGYQSISGSELSVEQYCVDNASRVVIGETFTLIYLLHHEETRAKVSFSCQKEIAGNLSFYNLAFPQSIEWSERKIS